MRRIPISRLTLRDNLRWAPAAESEGEGGLGEFAARQGSSAARAQFPSELILLWAVSLPARPSTTHIVVRDAGD